MCHCWGLVWGHLHGQGGAFAPALQGQKVFFWAAAGCRVGQVAAGGCPGKHCVLHTGRDVCFYGKHISRAYV